MQTSDFFSREINYISNKTLRKIVTETLDASPKCIQKIPASSSGKYHPEHSLGEGGLVRHIQSVVGICYSMFCSNIFRDMVYGYREITKDDIPLSVYEDAALAACILHDCCKAKDDDQKHKTQFDHPLLAANLFKKTVAKNVNADNQEYLKIVTPLVYKAIASHMGKWSTAPYAHGIVLPEPNTGFENYVHLCDYLSSRRFIDFNFDKYSESQW